ncbi:ABC-F family ATP-binding cassette domain-containing protein [Hoyosella rhizosphaerae]|uniref:ABC transporter ATP-binding protein n=1 Tax=Hoyosella rhizosphaerae TaxID=1755582 RepID=A0A916TZP9_9ACTN|nr:ABC-F family ATP-binding cassette domain-containing protein [Hoyosella rhizosphaerae]MBN4927186.1 ABC-F family ATP-binding cassette domain-containing protein [Hoyosella rhizosphaerae]GGC53329.1 ABC transporter ATP-binding protein [Hoyosella rhizosphaerae]
MPHEILRAIDLVKIYGDRRVIDGLNLTSAPGERIGLVGENGVGKSTLLRLLAGIEEPDDGRVERPQEVGYLAQELPYAPDTTIQEAVDEALTLTHQIVADLTATAEAVAIRPEDGPALDRYANRLARADEYGVWDAENRAETVLDRLGLGGIARSTSVQEISGGQRSRLALATLLIRQPRAMLLDEPTNHLDDAAITFLEEQLRTLPGTVVLASHDRAFLDAVCTTVIDLDPSRFGVTRYGGSYSYYLAEKRKERVRWEQQYAAEQAELRNLDYAVAVSAREVSHGRPMRDNNKLGYDRLGGRVDKQVSRRVRNAQRRFDELMADQVAEPVEVLRFGGQLTSTNHVVDDPLITVKDVVVPRRLTLDALEITASERLLITGPNGAGKSTLLTVLAGELQPTAGIVEAADGITRRMLRQDVWFKHSDRSASSTYFEQAGDDAPTLTALGLLTAAQANQAVAHLSVGQRRRLALAILLAEPPDVLLLDEPSNHLSLRLVEELEDAFTSAPGAIIVASHDRWLRARWDGREIQLHDGEVKL